MKSLKKFKAIGLMSGTSMDGVDAALIETDGLFYVRFLGGFSISHEPSFYAEMKAMEQRMKENFSLVPLVEKEHITRKIDALHIQAVLGLCQKYHLILKKPIQDTHDSIQDNYIDIIGYHGQTVYHQPQKGMTIQLGNPQYLANQLQAPVMGHVRQNDVKLGGQGAPVAPIYHQALVVRDNLVPSAVVNCGGISNVTIVAGQETTELYGFDVGPGNGLLDRWVSENTHGKELMDRNGQYALAGKVHPNVLKDLFEHSCIKNGVNYYTQKPPKSLDIRDFHWTDSLSALSLEDGCATLAVFTAQCIVDSLGFIPEQVKNVILVGGGWHHPLILQTLKDKVENICVVRGDEIGWSSQYLEAELMAYLAVRYLNQWPITFPMTTGVAWPVAGGEIFYPED